jgi:hypothetical protein
MIRFSREDEVKDKKNHVLSVDSDAPRSQADALHAVKRANKLSNASSGNKAGQPANIKPAKPVKNKKKAAAATPRPQPVPETTQPKSPGPSPAEAKETPEKPDLATPKGNAHAEDAVAIPRFNLAEQILVEQRKFASERRRKANPTEATGRSYAADDTVGAVIREVKDNMVRPVPTAPGADDANPAVCGTAVDHVDMADAQRLLIADIVTRDITALCTRRRHDSL